jgi:hypothetical protein
MRTLTAVFSSLDVDTLGKSGFDDVVTTSDGWGRQGGPVAYPATALKPRVAGVIATCLLITRHQGSRLQVDGAGAQEAASATGCEST